MTHLYVAIAHHCVAMQTLRLHRPRVIVYGQPGMGQRYLGPAALHHLEGYNVQSLELGSVLSDSTRVRCSLRCTCSLANVILDCRSRHRSALR